MNEICKMRLYLVVCFLVVKSSTFSIELPLEGASKIKEFDERQTGQYNVRLNLKDFQIIAVLGDTSHDVNNDNYDYEYEIPDDYLDIPNFTTQKNNNSSPEVSTVKITTANPAAHSSTTKPKKTTTSKPHTTTQKTKTSTINSSNGTSTNKSTKHAEVTTEQMILSPVHQIPVVVMQENPVKLDDFNIKKGDFPSIAIIPDEDFGENHSDKPVVLGQILEYKRCASGYSRDKRGRCRKLHRPQHSFDIARFATNLASRLTNPKEDASSRAYGE